MKNSSVVHGRRFYRAKVRDPLMAKYAAMTNPKEGEPGSKTNPLVRFGQEYVYSRNGELVPFHRSVLAAVSSAPAETERNRSTNPHES